MLLKLKAMLVKELKQMLRDPKMRMVVLGIPMVQMLVMSFALTLDVKNIDIAIIDRDRSATSRELISRIDVSDYFVIEAELDSFVKLREMMDKGTIRGAIIIDKNMQEKLQRGENAEIQVIADGTMSNDAGIIFSYVGAIVSQFNGGLIKGAVGVNTSPLTLHTRSMFNQNLSSSMYYVPGLITMMIMVTSILLTSIAIVREKEIGTIEQVMVTPIGRLEFIVGKTLPFFITGYITTTMMFVIAFMIFDVVIKGSILLLALCLGLNILAYLGLALLISTTAHTQQQALLTAFFILMPCSLLSGFMFPISNMPEPIQYLTYMDPMRWGFEAIIGIVSKGATAVELQRQILWQVGHAVFFILTASILFKKNLE